MLRAIIENKEIEDFFNHHKKDANKMDYNYAIGVY